MAKHIINNPGGRTRLPDDQVLGVTVAVRYSKAQMKRLKRKANGSPLRPYIRDSSLYAVVRLPVSRELMKEIHALNNLGANVNTIVKMAYVDGITSLWKKAEEAMDGINKILHEARLKIKPKEEDDETVIGG